MAYAGAGYGMPMGGYSGMPMGSYGGMAMGGYGAPTGVPGGQFYNSVQQQNGGMVDQYVVPGETYHVPEPVAVQGVSTVMENQMYMEPRQHTIKVPRTIMEPHEVTYQVPAYETRTHTAQRPRTVMEEQTITVQEPRMITEQVPIQVPVQQTIQAIVQHQKIVEYERPRVIPGRMINQYAGPSQTVGYSQAQIATAPVATTGYTQPMMGATMTQPFGATMTQPIGYGTTPVMGGYGGLPF